MSNIDWLGYHQAILKRLKDGPTSFDEIQNQTCLSAGALTSIIGGLMAKRCVYSTKDRVGHFEITPSGMRYLADLSIITSEKRSQT